MDKNKSGKILILIAVSATLFASRALAKCTVAKFSLEKQVFQVLRSGKRVSNPDLVCEGEPLASPSGRYLAFTRCERDYNRLGDDQRRYGLVIFNCETGRDAGYLPELRTSTELVAIDSWAASETELLLIKPLAGNAAELIPFQFSGQTALP